MPVFICRWPNGDCSFVSAQSKTEAIIRLDEIDNAETSEVFQVPDFMLHLRLADDGSFEFQDFGEDAWDEVRDACPTFVRPTRPKQS
jgi:hypothetical protein